MNKPNFTALAKTIKSTVTKRSPEILTGMGIAGMITTTVLAVKATPKALEIMEEEKMRRYKAYEDETLKPVDVIKLTWKCYVPAAITGITSTACLIGANSVSARRTAAIAAAYQLSEATLSEYHEKVIETIGEKKEKAVREKIAEERVKKNPVTKSEVFITNTGDTLFLEPISKRYFKSDIELVRRAENNLNKQMLHGISGFVSLSDLYDEIDLEHTEISDDLGWNVDRLIEIDFYPVLTDDGKPCISLEYKNAPKYNFDQHW